MNFVEQSTKPSSPKPQQTSDIVDLDALERRVGDTNPNLFTAQTSSIVSSSKKESAPSSPCELLSPFASKNLIRTKCQNFEKDVRSVIHQRLSNLPEVAFSYKESFQSFSCKLSHGSSFRFYEIDIYWDSNQNEHVVDVRRTGGEGFHRFSCDIFGEISKCFDVSYQARPVTTPWLAARTVPLALVEEIDAEILRKTGVSKVDTFLQGVGNIEALLRSESVTARVQAMQMVCDMAEPETASFTSSSSTLSLLCDSRCVPRIVSLVQDALNDKFQEVREFAVLAADALASVSLTYQTSLGQSSSIIASLLGELQSFSEKEAFLRAHTVRAAAKALVKLSTVASQTVKKEVAVLLRCEDETAWQQFVAALSDEQAKNTISQLTQIIFEKAGFPDNVRLESIDARKKNNVFTLSHLSSESAAVQYMTNVFNTLSSSSSTTSSSSSSSSICRSASSFSENEVAFYTKVFCRSEVSVFRTLLEYDEVAQHCVVEVSRVSGDGTFDFLGKRNASFFSTIRSLSLNNNSPQSAVKNDEEEDKDLIIISAPELTEEQFLSSLRHIVALTQDKFSSCRMQGLKLLMDTLAMTSAQSSSNNVLYWQSQECVSLIVNTLSSLLLESALVNSDKDSRWDEIELVLFTIAAFSTFNFNNNNDNDNNVFAKAFFPVTNGLLLILLRDTSVTGMDRYRHSLAVRAAIDILYAMFIHSECDVVEKRSILAETLNIEERSSWESFAALLLNYFDQDVDVQMKLQVIGSII